MENSKNLLRAFFVIATTVFMASSASAANDDVSDLIELAGCDAIGGTVIPQPAGSAITACCTETDCYICDANEDNCELDVFSKPTGDGKPGRPAAGTLSKPAVNGGSMIVQPDTNTTIGTPAKPIVRKSIIQNLKRN